MNAREILTINKIIPVITIHNEASILNLANAIYNGGVSVLEITLRSPYALKAIKLISENLPDVIVGAGTIISAKQFEEVIQAGAKFIITPGINEKFLREIPTKEIPIIPGIGTPGEIMLCLEYGLNTLKFFPAECLGGIAMLKSLSGPFGQVKFCPTGGITMNNAKDYLRLPNVLCVGGSWLALNELVEQQNWSKITKLAQMASEL